MDSPRHRSEELDDIFENLGEPVECVQHYVPNGLNPTYLGDTVGKERTPDSIQTLDKDARHKVGEVPSISEPAHAKKPQERFNAQLYPSIVSLYEWRSRKDEEVPKTLAEFTALNPLLRDRWMSEKHPDMQPEESELVLNLLQSLLICDPDQRFSTKQLLQHAWIRSYCASGRKHSESVEGTETAVAKKKRKRSVSEGNHN